MRDQGETMDEILRLLAITAHNLYSVTLSASTEAQREIHARMTSPREGDVVVERSLAHAASDPEQWNTAAIGTLTAMGYEAVGDAGDTEMTYYVTTFDGHIYRWVHAAFLAILDGSGYEAFVVPLAGIEEMQA